jgi:hypothetical protein
MFFPDTRKGIRGLRFLAPVFNAPAQNPFPQSRDV